jgi:hypothetical protein
MAGEVVRSSRSADPAKDREGLLGRGSGLKPDPVDDFDIEKLKRRFLFGSVMGLARL